MKKFAKVLRVNSVEKPKIVKIKTHFKPSVLHSTSLSSV